jgi:hypothetical protein
MKRPEDEDDHAKTEVLSGDPGKPDYDPDATAVLDEEYRRQIQTEIKTQKPR